MKKIPTIFLRDWDGDRSKVTREPNPECAWVFAGEGVSSVKIDGTCCMVRAGKLYKRREIKPGQTVPPDFESCGEDTETGKTVGWVPVGDGPDDQYHREAAEAHNKPPFAVRTIPSNGDPTKVDLPDGTYELIGPKIQGNPEKSDKHALVPHANLRHRGDINLPPRDFDGLSAWLGAHDVEGLVWHHPDGRMAKIKGRDFGHKRGGK